MDYFAWALFGFALIGIYATARFIITRIARLFGRKPGSRKTDGKVEIQTPKRKRTSAADRIDLEPEVIQFDYTDAGREETRRTATMLSIEPGPHAPLLRARCHARKAMRAFRTDRMRDIVDMDGEVFTPEDFFWTRCDIDLTRLQERR